MTNKKRVYASIVLLIFFFALLYRGINPRKNKTFSSASANVSTGVPKEEYLSHKVQFYDEKAFIDGIHKAGDSVREKKYLIKGGIVPHHLYPSFIIADFFYQISLQNPETIILIGPNHYERGNFKALTGAYAWETVVGKVKHDKNIIETLVGKNVVRIDEVTLSSEHSLSSMMPFIKYYMPNTKVVPILLSGIFSKRESAILAAQLSELLTKDMILVVSVDFSHYLISPQAKEKDAITLQIMKNFDYEKLYLLNNDYLDSPPSIGILLMVMQKLQTTKMDVVFHTNSGELQNDDSMETTSYFSIFYH